MEIKDLKIKTLMFQPSVVSRGLEKKLSDMGNSVESITGDFSGVEDTMNDTDVYLFNLPTKLADDTHELRELEKSANMMSSKGQSMILVGEKEVYNELTRAYKWAANFVWLYRPVEDNALEAAVEKALSNKPKPPAGNRILIVDDDPDYAKMVRGWIKDSYKVDIVTAGMQAISFLLKLPENEQVSLILLDYEMPVVDGPQVLQMLRQEPATVSIPVVFLTGVSTREGVARVMELKPDGYILKSTTKEDLLAFLAGKLKY